MQLKKVFLKIKSKFNKHITTDFLLSIYGVIYARVFILELFLILSLVTIFDISVSLRGLVCHISKSNSTILAKSEPLFDHNLFGKTACEDL